VLERCSTNNCDKSRTSIDDTQCSDCVHGWLVRLVRYRPEIDGLRALAIVPVILFHAGIPGFSGGFVGVDVFFVISGYLITSIILSEIRLGSFSFLAFYERRARRILPPLFLVALVCIPFAIWAMVPRDVVDFSKSLMAVSGFASNLFFWGQSGYFDTDNELKPLLHTWSLAVEEQFYLVFPLILLLTLRAGQRRIIPLFLALAAVSFALAFWGAHHHKEAAFYLLPTRMWELLIGSLIPMLAVDVERWFPKLTRELLAALGLAFIVITVVAYDYMPLHSVYALLPTVGALFIIQFSSAQTVVGRLLGTRALVGIGLISYSAYLWHQPVFVFARLSLFHEPNTGVFLALSLLSVGLAVLTYKFVERPVRDRKRVGRRSIFVLSAAGTICLALLGLGGILTSGLESVYVSRNGVDTQQVYDLIKRNTGGDLTLDMGVNDDCNFWSPTVDTAFRSRFERCAEKYGPATVVIGDSHGMNIYNALFRANYGKFVVGLVNPGCRPWSDSPECPYLGFRDFLVANQNSVGTVILHISGSHLLTDASGREEPASVFEYGWNYQIYYKMIEFTENYLENMSGLTHVIWLGPFVEARVNFREVGTFAKTGFHLNPMSMYVFDALEKAIGQSVSSRPRKFKYISFSEVVKPDRDFLRVGDCLTYRDVDHLSVCGEKIVGENLKSVLSLSVRSDLGAGSVAH
jgi:peptidoglycan/LPS O-acetylase OafA/YrhL